MVHAAGVVDEGALEFLTPERLARVLRATAGVAGELDRLTADAPLEAFVVFSSIAGTFGGLGQASFAAANAYLDALAEHRRGRGLPATAIAWGPPDSDGSAPEDPTAPTRRDLLRRRGMADVAVAEVAQVLQQALDADEATLVVADIDWSRFAPALTADRARPLISEIPEAQQALGAGAEEADGGNESSSSLRQRLRALTDEDQRRLLVDLVRSEVASILGYGTDQVGSARPFKELGFDSVNAVGLRNRLGGATGLKLPPTLVFDYPTPEALADHLLGELGEGLDGATSVDGALDQLRTALDRSPGRNEDRSHAIARLQELVSELSHVGRATAKTTQEIEAASDEELFQLIENDLSER